MLGGFHIFINRIVGYSDLGGVHVPVLEGLHIFINRIIGYSDLGASCPGIRWITHLYK